MSNGLVRPVTGWYWWLVLVVAGCAAGPPGPVRSAAPLAPAPARSEAPPDTPASPLPELSEKAGLGAYLEYAALNNPGLESAFLGWKAALERVPQARTLPDPRFTYRYFIREVETRVGPQRQSFGISQMFPWFGTLELQGSVAMEAAHAARQRYEAEKLTLFYRVKDAYYEYYYLARAIGVVRENRDLLTYLEGVVRTRYKVAAAGHPDVIRAQVELGRLDDRFRTAESLRGPLAARLNAALGRAIDTPVPWPASPPPREPVAATDDEILGWLREASPELKALEFEVAGRRKAIDLAKKGYYPDVTLGVDYIDTRDAVMPGVGDSGRDPVVAMLSVNIPLWYEKYAAGVREAEARHWAALKHRLDRENTLGGEVKMVLYRFRDAERKMNLYRDTLLPKARQSLKATEASFRTGQATFTDLVDAERVLLEFSLAYERALADHAQRLAELEMLVGREIPRADAKSPDDPPKGEKP
ncbi:MAG TPA: TolC family protein [Phycisphaerae bacterium]|nr:TolC family protein [Phycisphaerae bacterium]